MELETLEKEQAKWTKKQPEPENDVEKKSKHEAETLFEKIQGFFRKAASHVI